MIVSLDDSARPDNTARPDNAARPGNAGGPWGERVILRLDPVEAQKGCSKQVHLQEQTYTIRTPASLIDGTEVDYPGLLVPTIAGSPSGTLRVRFVVVNP